MSMKPPRLILEPNPVKCRTLITWDQDSFVLSWSVVSLNEKKEEVQYLNLSEKLDRKFGIHQDGYRLVLGEMDILLDSDQCMQAVEIRTNPFTWQRDSLRPLSKNPDPARVYLVADYDANRLASYEIPIRITRDVPNQALSFSFGNFASFNWTMISENFFAGMTLDHYLSEFRLVNLNIAFEEKV